MIGILKRAWVPERLGKKVTAAALRKRALYEILLEQGVTFGRVVQEISAEVCDPVRARLLQTEVGMPLLKLVRVIYDPDSRPVQYISVAMTSDRSRLLMDVPGDAVNTPSAGQMVHEVTPRNQRGR